jgi:hypothetical protein
MFLMQIPVSVVSSLTAKHHAQIVGRFTWVPSPKGRFTLWPKVERIAIRLQEIKHSTSQPFTLRAGLHYGGEGLRSVKNAWPRHGYIRQMVDVPEKN